MIRMVLFGLAFLGITVGLLVLQPGSNRPVSQPYSEPVTRAEPAFDIAPDAPMVAEAAESVPLLPQPEPAAPEPVARLIPQPAPVLAPAAPLDDQSLRRLTWTTLSGLNHATGRDSAPGQPGSLLHTIVRRSLDDGAPQPGAAAPEPAIPAAYVVEEGDSLVSIAEKFYGDMNMTGPLFAANQAIIGRPDDLRPGQVLTLPRE